MEEYLEGRWISIGLMIVGMIVLMIGGWINE